MASTAASLASAPARTAESYTTRDRAWRDQTVVSVLGNLGGLAQKNNSVKLGLVLVALWVLNWIF